VNTFYGKVEADAHRNCGRRVENVVRARHMQ
jgi:hypothetical protein